jgi:hypothetical protein
LKEYRESVYDALRKVKVDAIAMEDYVAKDQRPLQNCLEDVASCDIYVGIFAWRYGYIPTDNNKDNNPNNLSITELEYRKAKEKGIPCLIFLLDETVPWPLKYSDGTPQSGTRGDDINRLRNELKKNHSVSFFKNKDELAGNVLAAVNSTNKRSFTEQSPSKSIEQVELFKVNMPTQSPLHFLGEKRIFVGREDYIDKKIKDLLKEPGSRVSIVGPGGSGKSQLAFKAIHQYYDNDKMIDLVIPLYLYTISSTFSSVLTSNDHNTETYTKAPVLTFKKFLKEICFQMMNQKILQIPEQQLEQMNIEYCKSLIYNIFSTLKHPLLYCDNFETLSSILDENKHEKDIKTIFNFLNNELPQNTSIMVTSRYRRNFLVDEQIIDLKGLKVEEGINLFIKYASAYKNHLEDKKQLIEIIVTKTGGHPLSLEILANSYEGGGSRELEMISQTLGIERENPFESEERLQTLHRSFQYSIDKLDLALKNLLSALTIFHYSKQQKRTQKSLIETL